MAIPLAITLRRATPEDATVIGALAIQVFLDTYARNGVRPDLAREAIEMCGPAHYARRLAGGTPLLLAVDAGHVLGFAEWDPRQRPAPGQWQAGCELVRLYVQSSAHRHGVGARLLAAVEAACRSADCAFLWLTAWAENTQALAFYLAQGYDDVGASEYRFEEQCYENRVFVKTW